jgi:hypothetical protein
MKSRSPGNQAGYELTSLQVLLSGARISTPARISSGSAKNTPATGINNAPTKASNRLIARTTTPKTLLDIFIEKHSILFMENSLFLKKAAQGSFQDQGVSPLRRTFRIRTKYTISIFIPKKT